MDTEDLVIPDKNKKRSAEKSAGGILSKSIDASDLSYIQEFLRSDERMEEVRKLNKKEKEALIVLLVEFLDQPVRLEAMEMIYEIIKEVGNVEDLSNKLVKRAVDFNKLVYLKGKIDYLKYMDCSTKDQEPMNEHSI